MTRAASDKVVKDKGLVLDIGCGEDKKGGVLEIRCPDLRARAFLFFLNPSWQDVRNIYGAQDYAGNYHKCGFSYGLLKDLLESCGIHKVKRVIKGYKGIPFLPDCLHVKGVKKHKPMKSFEYFQPVF
jgi:hypothetical protein